ncbi:MAG: hypothetical protein V4670_08415 [Bacteroidota bacterium]
MNAKKLAIINLIFFVVFACSRDNKILVREFENEFSDSITKHNAKFFAYQYDGLVPQKSYFIDSKLKFLQYKHGPENGSVESMVFFDMKTDSLKKIVRRIIYYDWDDERNERTRNFSDTLYVIQVDKRKTLTYVNNELIDSIFKPKVLDNDKRFIIEMKKQTEISYNSR